MPELFFAVGEHRLSRFHVTSCDYSAISWWMLWRVRICICYLPEGRDPNLHSEDWHDYAALFLFLNMRKS